MSRDNHSSDGISPGEMLAAERKKLGLRQEEVAESLKITASRLKAIEQNNYSDFPSETYTRGYLRNYARLVNLDEKVVIDAYGGVNATGGGAETAEATLSAILVRSSPLAR